MRISKLWGAVGALALAATGVVMGGGTAQGAEIPDASGRSVGPFVYSDWSGPHSSYYVHLYRSVSTATTFVQVEGVKISGNSQAPPWVTDPNDPRWAQVAVGADLISVPGPGETGDVKFVSGAAQGKCLSAASSGTQRKVTIEACGANTAKWSVEARPTGFLLAYRDTPASVVLYYNQQYINTLTSLPVPTFPDHFNGTMFTPEMRTVEDVTAHLVGEPTDGSVDVAGTGEPGASITVTGPDGAQYPATVGPGGAWGPVTIPGLPAGTHELPVAQVVEGHPAGETSVTVTVPDPPAPEPADLTAQVDDVDHEDKSADLSGTGEPGATVEVRDSDGDVLAETVVDEDGTWSVTVPGLTDGDNDLSVVQVIEGEDESSVDLSVSVHATLFAEDLTVHMEQDSVAEVDVLAQTSGDEVRLVEVSDLPGHGSAQIVDGVVMYTPEVGFTGEDVFVVTVADMWGVTTTVTVTVLVAPFEDVPMVSAGVGLAGLALVGLGGVGLRVRAARRS